MANIVDALGIKVTKGKVGFIADATKLPYVPPIGRGKTEDEARFDLLAKLMWDIMILPIDRGYAGPVSHLMGEAHARDKRRRK